MSAIDIISARCPQFVGHSRLFLLLDYAEEYLLQCVWKDKWNLAKALLVCHWLTMEANNQASDDGAGTGSSGTGRTGQANTVQEGELMLKWDTQSQSGSGAGNGGGWDWLKSTQYGMELYMLIRSLTLMPRNQWVGRGGCNGFRSHNC